MWLLNSFTHVHSSDISRSFCTVMTTIMMMFAVKDEKKKKGEKDEKDKLS